MFEEDIMPQGSGRWELRLQGVQQKFSRIGKKYNNMDRELNENIDSIVVQVSNSIIINIVSILEQPKF